MADSDLFTLSRLAKLTGRDRRALERVFRDIEPKKVVGRRKYWDFVTSAKALYGSKLGDDIDSLKYRKFRAETEQAEHRAQMDALALEQTAGSLTAADGVRQAARADARRVRDRMMKLGDLLAPELAVEEDTAAIKSRLDGEIRMALEHLADGGG